MPPSDAQLNYLVYEPGVTNAEAAQLLERDPKKMVTKISQLTRREAFLLIANKLDSLVRTFHPDAEADVNIDLTTAADGLECGYRGRAIIRHYETVYTEEGLYTNLL